MSSATVCYVVLTDPKTGRKSDVAVGPTPAEAAVHMAQLASAHGISNLALEPRKVEVQTDAKGAQVFPPKGWTQ